MRTRVSAAAMLSTARMITWGTRGRWATLAAWAVFSASGLVVAANQAASPESAAPADSRPVTLFVEAEGFDNLGGWLIDQQFMDQMGSPMLLAHGLGVPVADAETTIALPRGGEYRIWVRTRDWCAPWNAPVSPGRLQILVDGRALPTVFGTEGAAWHWQDGGIVRLSGPGKLKLTLHDLTGFDGRCDAIVLTTDTRLALPNQGEALERFRRELLGLPETPPEAGQFDLVVVGGGMAGCCAAVSAARLGLQVALIQNRPVLGGNNSSEVRVHLNGNIHLPPYPALGGVVHELDSFGRGNAGPAAQYGDEKKLAVVRAEPNLHLFLDTHVCRVEMDGRRIVAAVAKNIRTGRELRFPGRWFADCTGDGNLGYLAGADFRYGRESRAETGEPLAPEKPDRQVMGASVQWRTVLDDQPVPFPDCPWAIQFNAQNYQRALSGDWNWETGFRWDQIEQSELIRDHGLRAVFGNWAFQKNHAPDKERYANYRLEWVAYVAGKRESRRLLGDVILRQQDVVEGRPYPDACVTTTWTIDLHYPIQSDQFPGQEFRSRAENVPIKPYAIPYRCLYSRNTDNLFMAGRCISVTHVALGTVRVMRTCGMMGEVVGMAAAVCKRRNADPRQVYTDYLDDLKELMERGVGRLPLSAPKPPDWVPQAGANLARSAAVAVSSRYGPGQYPPEHVNDGRADFGDNSLRFVSGPELPGFVELTWPRAQRIGAVRILTGQSGSQGPQTPIADFVVKYHDGTTWRAIPGTQTTGNTAADWHARFSPIDTQRLRLEVTAAPGNLIRIWEWEVYGPVADGGR